MVVKIPGLTIWALFTFALILSVEGCSDVPLDAATYRTDTLAQTDPELGEAGHDTIVPTYGSIVPQTRDWRAISLSWVRIDSSGGGRRRRLETTSFNAAEAEVRLDTVMDNGYPVEFAKIELHFTFPERVTGSMIALADPPSDYFRVVPVKKFDLEVSVPIPSPRHRDSTAKLDGGPGDYWKGWAEIIVPFPPPGTRQSFSTGSSGSQGTFKFMGIDRKRRVIYASIPELVFKIDGSPKATFVYLNMDLVLNY